MFPNSSCSHRVGDLNASCSHREKTGRSWQEHHPRTYRQILSPTESLNNSNLALSKIWTSPLQGLQWSQCFHVWHVPVRHAVLELPVLFGACGDAVTRNMNCFTLAGPHSECHVQKCTLGREEYEDNLQQMPTKQTFSAKTVQIGAFEIGTFQMPPTTVKDFNSLPLQLHCRTCVDPPLWCVPVCSCVLCVALAVMHGQGRVPWKQRAGRLVPDAGSSDGAVSGPFTVCRE